MNFATLTYPPNPVNVDEKLLKSNEVTLVKIRYYPYNCDKVFTCRKFLMNKRMQLMEFREKLRVRFNLDSDIDFALFYYDEIDRISVTLDEELAIGLYQNYVNNSGYRYATAFELREIKEESPEVVYYGESEVSKVVVNIDNGKEYELNDDNDIDDIDNVIDNDIDNIDMGGDDNNSIKSLTKNINKESKEKFIKNKDPEIKEEKNITKNNKNNSENFVLAKVTYPENLIGRYGDFNEITFKSEDLILDKVDSEAVWGTKIYTFDSDHLAAFLHSYPLIKLSDTPPDFDISAVVQILPGQSRYEASSSNGINSEEFEDYNASFMFISFTSKEHSKDPGTPPRKKRKTK